MTWRQFRDVRTASKLGRGTAKGLAISYLSLLVLIPLAALLTNAFNKGLGSFWTAVTQQESLDALRLTLLCAFVASAINAVAGLATAWVLVRDRFAGQAIVNAIIDLPFALPTVVAGVTFYTLYGPLSPFHVNITGTWIGVTVAIMFVTLPFTVRSVQPVLESLTFNAESAAATLGASPLRIFRTITLPALMPALLTGTGLAFARAIGEYGSVVFISNNLPYRSEVASSYIYSLAVSDQTNSAASVAVALLVIALILLIIFNVTAQRLAKRRA
ncbi:MAG: sulfate ABC transporter permease subunit CysT [Acidimicrobiales bacterium]